MIGYLYAEHDILKALPEGNYNRNNGRNVMQYLRRGIILYLAAKIYMECQMWNHPNIIFVLLLLNNA